MGPRPSDGAVPTADRMRSRLSRTVKEPLSSVAEITETEVPQRKPSPPVAPKRASLRDRIARRPSLQNQTRPAFGAMPAAPQLPPGALARRQSTASAPRTRPPVPSRDRKPALGQRRSFPMSRHPDFAQESETECSSNLSTNTEVTSVLESDTTPTLPPPEKDRRVMRRPIVARKSVVPARVMRPVAAAPPAQRTIHIQVQQPSQRSSSEDVTETAVTEYKEEIKRLKQEVMELRDSQTSSDRGLEDALDRLSLATLEREEVRTTSARERQTLVDLKREVEQRCLAITGLKARLEDRERTLDEMVGRFDARTRELDGERARGEAVGRSLEEVKAILANREDIIVDLRRESDLAGKERDEVLKTNEELVGKAESFDELSRRHDELLEQKEETETQRGELLKEKEIWEMEREKFSLETESLRDSKTELEAKVDELMKEIGTRLAVRSDQEEMLIERVAALEIIKESLDGQVERLSTQVAEGRVEIEGLEKVKGGLEEELEKEVAKSKALEEEKAGFEETVKGLEEEKSGLASAKAELEGAKGSLETDKAALAEEKSTLEARVGELEGDITELKSTIEGLEGEKTAQEEQITALTTERDTLQSTTSEQEGQLKELRDGGAATQSDIDTLRESEAAAKSDLEKIKESEEALKADLEKIREENTTLQNDLTAARSTPDAPADAPALDDLQKEITELKQRNEELQESITKVTADLEEQSSKASAATTKLEEESKRLEEESKKMEEEFKKLEEESKRLESDATSEAQAKVVELEGKLSAAAAQVDQLGAAHQAELAGLKVQIQRLSRVTSRSKSPKKKKAEELVIVRNPHDRSSLYVSRRFSSLL